MMEFTLLVNKEQKSLTVAPLPSGEGHTARIDGREYLLRWVPINDNEWLLDIDGHPIRACLAARGGETWISIEGGTYRIEEPGGAERRPRRRGGPDDQSRQVTPPMPAAVIRILATEGDLVNRGQSLIVLSAMKMEITLTAPYRGAVKKIHVAIGAQVMPGEILLEIEPAEEEHNGV
jgi:acetyl/propionyl-CoA carboxylase alpha subunit